MRITNRMLAENSIGYMSDGLEQLSELQTRVATGKVIQTPADNPTVAVASLSMRSTLATNQAYLDTSYVTRDWLNANELALKDLVEIGTRAHTLTLPGLSDTLGVAERDALAQEVAGILQHAVDVGNTKHQDKHIFAGFEVNTQPYMLDTTNPLAPVVVENFTAPTGQMRQSIAPSQTMQVNVNPETALTPFLDALAGVYTQLAAPVFNRAGLQTALDTLYTEITGVKDARTTNGARQHQLQTEMDRLEQTKVALKNLLTHKEDVNMAEAISLLKHQETVYQTVLQVGSKSVTQSLFDYLR